MTDVCPASKKDIEEMCRQIDGGCEFVYSEVVNTVVARIRLLEECLPFVAHGEGCPSIYHSDISPVAPVPVRGCTCGLAEKLARLEEIDRT